MPRNDEELRAKRKPAARRARELVSHVGVATDCYAERENKVNVEKRHLSLENEKLNDEQDVHERFCCRIDLG